ncbi:hypothetical protein, partial [Plasmodium yoelii yoelii]
GLFKYNYPYDKKNKRYIDCEKNYERINTLGTYLYYKLNRIDKNVKDDENNDHQYIECMLLWTSNILLQIRP